MMNLSAFLLIFGLTLSAAFGKIYFPETPLDAAMRRKPKVVGGVEVEPHSLPYQAALFLSTGFCGGTLISSRYVLTAAHCLSRQKGVKVVLGAHKVKEDEDSQVVLNAKRLIVHEDYEPFSLSNDIGLIELPQKVTFNEHIQPVILPSADAGSFTHYQANVSGWGYTVNNGPSISPVLRTVRSRILLNEDCAKKFGFKVRDTVICLDGTLLKSACNGDSGGPLTVETEDGDLQIGVVSFGSSAGCGKGFPSAFTRVTHYIDWIKRNSDYKEDSM